MNDRVNKCMYERTNGRMKERMNECMIGRIAELRAKLVQGMDDSISEGNHKTKEWINQSRSLQVI